ncbi:MAG: aminoglycoside phosphotransferase (APT) family kinase protein [Bermanella sp.]|jgi:aminoglycoside phosphotransferase (APT) family kinase protein
MSLINTAKLAGFATGQWATIVVDALRDRLGTSIPFDASDFTQPEHLNKMINNHGVEHLSGPAHISSVQKQDIPSVSSNCNNVVLTIAQEGSPVLPQSLFVKLPLPSLLTRWFFNVIGSWELESHFCKHVAPKVPLRTPKTYATHCEGSRFFLIQENLHDDPSVKLFTNPDMMTGPSLDIARRCLDAFARLHACHYDLDTAGREAILPFSKHLFLGGQMGLISRGLNRMSLDPCMKAAPGIIPPAIEASYRKTLENWDKMLEFWFSGPLSLLHGDSHLGNFFVSGDEMGMLDFQAVHWGKGIRDVQYFLIYSLPADILAANEQELVRYYVERRAVYGTAINFDTTWQEYRSLTYQTLMTMVVSIGFGAMNEEQNALMAELLSRVVAAQLRVDYPQWLDDYLDKNPSQ